MIRYATTRTIQYTKRTIICDNLNDIVRDDLNATMYFSAELAALVHSLSFSLYIWRRKMNAELVQPIQLEWTNLMIFKKWAPGANNRATLMWSTNLDINHFRPGLAVQRARNNKSKWYFESKATQCAILNSRVASLKQYEAI